MMIYEKFNNDDEFATYLVRITSLEQFWREKEPHENDEENRVEAEERLGQGEPLEDVLMTLTAREYNRFVRNRYPDRFLPDPRVWVKPDPSSEEGLFQNVIYLGPDTNAPQETDPHETSLLSNRPVSIRLECDYHEAMKQITRTIQFPDRPRPVTLSQWHWNVLAFLAERGFSAEELAEVAASGAQQAMEMHGGVCHVETAFKDVILSYYDSVMEVLKDIPNDNRLPGTY